MKETEDKAILAARVPKALVRKLDSAAKKNRRTRSAEMLLRLEQSFAVSPAMATKGA